MVLGKRRRGLAMATKPATSAFVHSAPDAPPTVPAGQDNSLSQPLKRVLQRGAGEELRQSEERFRLLVQGVKKRLRHPDARPDRACDELERGRGTDQGVDDRRNPWPIIRDL